MFMQRTLGDIEAMIGQLTELVPFEGTCKFPRSNNKALDKFRRAQNVVYDFFNNGLGNRRSQFLAIFGDAPHRDSFRYFNAERWDRWEDFIAPQFRQIILDAAVEQGIQIQYPPHKILWSEYPDRNSDKVA